MLTLSQKEYKSEKRSKFQQNLCVAVTFEFGFTAADDSLQMLWKNYRMHPLDYREGSSFKSSNRVPFVVSVLARNWPLKKNVHNFYQFSVDFCSKSLCLLPYNDSQHFQDHSDPPTEPKQLISTDIELAEEWKKEKNY